VSSQPTKCRLCEREGTLCDSHILPEFIFRPTYEVETRAATQVDLERQRVWSTQRGFTERLLCGDCEAKFNRWETYFSRVWYHPTQALRPSTLSSQFVRVSGLDYANFKLFHLSIVWRCGVSKLSFFQQVRLGAHEPKLRKRLLLEDPGTPEQYPMLTLALRDHLTGGFQDTLVTQPRGGRMNGRWFYALTFGGVMWHYLVSEHTQGYAPPFLFGTNGVLTLGVQDYLENKTIQDIGADIRKFWSGT
jgi:hypothetical protein